MTRPWLLNLILLLAIGLASARLFSTLTYAPSPLPEVEEVSEQTLPVSVGPAPAPPAAYAEIAERNLFSSRRGKKEPPRAETEPEEPAKPVAAPKATLFGIVTEDGGERYAYMTDDASPQKGKPKKYREGDPFAGTTVKEILSDRVILASGAREHTLSLRAPKSGIEEYQPPPPAVQGLSAPPPVRPRRTVPQVRSRRQVLEESRQARRVPVRRRRFERAEEDYPDMEEGFPGYDRWPEEEESFFDDEDYDEEFYEGFEDGEEGWEER